MAFKIREKDLSEYRKLTPSEGAKAYADLRKEVMDAGILDRSYGYYSALFFFLFFAFAVSLYYFIVSKNPFLLMISATMFSFFGVQIAGLIHDAGHRSIFKSSLLNDLIGFFCSAIVGFAYRNWRDNHNKHHANPNGENEDPDLELPFSFTEDRWKDAGGFIGFIRRHQALLYFPIGSLSTFSIRFKTLGFYLNDPKIYTPIEILAFGIGMAGWYVLPFIFFPFFKAMIFIVITNFLSGFYLMSIFAPNHKGMPQIGKDVKFSFLEQQIITARNIYGHAITDTVYLGLNYQIEHHLFPNCPRNKLSKISPYVERLCKKYRLAYTQVSILESNRFILSELNKISKT